jgi:hypothetical protein
MAGFSNDIVPGPLRRAAAVLAWFGAAVLSGGFRPLFLAVGVWALVGTACFIHRRNRGPDSVEEVYLNLAHRWFCRLGLTAASRIIRRFPRTASAVSARATYFGNCSRP